MKIVYWHSYLAKKWSLYLFQTLNIHNPHSWTLSENEATVLQKELASKVTLNEMDGTVQLVAGVDVAYTKTGNFCVAGVVVLEVGSLQILEAKSAYAEITFPYVPGLFSFRELPAVLRAIVKLESTPDLIICDGHGIAHHRLCENGFAVLRKPIFRGAWSHEQHLRRWRYCGKGT